MRRLIVTADDFGIGVETSRGILDLAARGAVTSTVLLANSPFAAESVRLWRHAGGRLELGWHPCLTLDAPILSAEEVPSLVTPTGQFPTLGEFLKRVVRGRIVEAEAERELRAQLARFVQLVGTPPPTVNGHHHCHIFGVVHRPLVRILTELTPRPFLRRVVEPWRTLAWVPGARVKRLALSRIGRRATTDLPRNDWLLGITDPPCVHNPRFFERWLSAAKGECVELTCHPGYFDVTLVGRDGTLTDGQLHRRPAEFERLREPTFREAVKRAGFTLTPAGVAGRAAA